MGDLGQDHLRLGGASAGQQVEEEKEEIEVRDPSKIMLVDNEAGARLMMRSLLEKEGYEVHEAVGGQRRSNCSRPIPISHF